MNKIYYRSMKRMLRCSYRMVVFQHKRFKPKSFSLSCLCYSIIYFKTGISLCRLMHAAVYKLHEMLHDVSFRLPLLNDLSLKQWTKRKVRLVMVRNVDLPLCDWSSGFMAAGNRERDDRHAVRPSPLWLSSVRDRDKTQDRNMYIV